MAVLVAATTAVASPKPGSRPPVAETTFESVDSVVAAQWDFPAEGNAPLVLLVPPAGRIDRHGSLPDTGNEGDDGIYAQLTDLLVSNGFAVFRYDAPGAGRSSPGRYATDRSTALEAYRRAVDHARIDASRVFLIGHSSGTGTIAGIYPRYEDINPVAGVVLLSNQVGERAAVRITAPTLVVVGDEAPEDRFQFGEFVADARKNEPGSKLATKLVVIKDAPHALLAQTSKRSDTVFSIDPRATKAILRWLMEKRGFAHAP